MSTSVTGRFPSLPLSSGPVREPDSAEVGFREVLEVSDEVLLSRVHASDTEALATLFRRYAKVVHSVGRKILRDDTEADDLVQDVFLYLRRKCGVYDPAKGAASSWIIQTIYYQALQRRMKLAARHFYSSSEIEGSGEVAAAASNGGQQNYFAEVVFGKSKWREILQALTEDQWETLRLHFFEGYTLGEIAEKRGLSVGNIRHHFYRGLESLRKQVFSDELLRRGKTSGIDPQMSSRGL